MALQSPERDQVVSVRLSIEEKRRLEVFARERDLKLGQACRQFLNRALDTEERHPTSLDGAH